MKIILFGREDNFKDVCFTHNRVVNNVIPILVSFSGIQSLIDYVNLPSPNPLSGLLFC